MILILLVYWCRGADTEGSDAPSGVIVDAQKMKANLGCPVAPLIFQTRGFGAEFYAPYATSSGDLLFDSRCSTRCIKFSTKSHCLKNQGPTG